MTPKRLVIGTFAISRGMMLIVAAYVMLSNNKSMADVLGNWDVQHFLAIARNGYAEANDVAFFPGWPMVLRFIDFCGLPMIATGALLATGLSAVAAAALYRIGGPMAAVVWLLAPTAVFTAVPYTESLFCAAAFWAWERAGSKHWGQAAGLAALAATVRVSGLFLIGALALYALTQSGPWLIRFRRWLWLLIPAGVLATYVIYLYFLRGSWTVWYDAQVDGWYRGFTWPWDCLSNTIEASADDAYPDSPEWHHIFRAETISWVLGILTTIVCLFRKKLAEAAWVFVQVLAFCTSAWLMSVNRALLLWFPLWTELGGIANTRSPILRPLLAVAGAALLCLQCTWAWLFFTGHWAS
ncbi:MAG: hypothetical protein LBR58_03075 [Propionibacteriaceae bacterium]|nr:hypothetical protein [Propionibacteriaceae bacterium]